MSPYHVALGFVLLTLAGLAAWVVWLFRRSPFTPPQTVLYYLDVLLCRLLWRADIPDRLPPGCEHGAVIVANHRSSIDPFFIQLLSKTPVHWMVAAEYFASPLFGWFLRQTEAIPTRRGGADTTATRAALRYAQEGGLVGMFPEGRINVTDELLLPVRPGAALVALRAKVPLLPCYIEGSPYDGKRVWSPLFMRARVKVRFGQPIDLSEHFDSGQERKVAKQVILQAMREIACLAGHEDFEPQLAGRKWMPDANGMIEEDDAAGEPEPSTEQPVEEVSRR